MKIKIIIGTLLIAHAAHAGNVTRWGSYTGYDLNTTARIDHERQRLQLTNYQTGMSQQIRLRPKYGGNGYRASEIDMNTGALMDINVDRRGNVEIWSY